MDSEELDEDMSGSDELSDSAEEQKEELLVMEDEVNF